MTKYFVKTVYIIIYLRFIHVTFSAKTASRNIHSVEICKFFPHDFLQNFRQINFFTKDSYVRTVDQFDKNFEVKKMSEIITLWGVETSKSRQIP